MTARRILTILFAAILLVACNNENEYIIKGEYKGVPDGTVVYMTTVDYILNVVDSAVVKNGTFEFRGEAGNTEIRYISTNSIIDGGYVAVEPGEIRVRIGGKSISSGTENNDRLSSFIEKSNEMAQLQMLLIPEQYAALEMSDGEIDSMSTFIGKEIRKFEEYAIGCIKENMSSPLGSFFLSRCVGIIEAKKLEPLFKEVPQQYRDNLYERKLKILNEVIAQEKDNDNYRRILLENATRSSAGKEMQNFEMNDITGKDVLFSDIVFANKQTILVFWASWNKGSVENAREIDRLYKEYHKKGVCAVGLSLDNSLEELTECISHEQFEWLQLCNTAGGSTEVATAYGISELPTIILIDNKGTIIERELTIEELEAMLKNL